MSSLFKFIKASLPHPLQRKQKSKPKNHQSQPAGHTSGPSHPLQQDQKSGPVGHTSDLPLSVAPLLALPTELKLHIISYLHDKEDPEPTLIILPRTHHIFRQLTPFAPYRFRVLSRWDPTLRESKKKKLLQAERKYPYLFPPKTLPCYRCLCVMKRSNFDQYVHAQSRNRQQLLGCEDAHTRICHSCCSNGIPPETWRRQPSVRRDSRGWVIR